MGRRHFKAFNRAGFARGLLRRYQRLNLLSADFEGFKLANGFKTAVEALVIRIESKDGILVALIQTCIKIP